MGEYLKAQYDKLLEEEKKLSKEDKKFIKAVVNIIKEEIPYAFKYEIKSVKKSLIEKIEKRLKI